MYSTHSRVVLLGDQRSELGGRVGGVADADVAGALGDVMHEPLVERTLDEQA